MDNREKAIITGLYLSKYDREGLREMGFNSFQEAFNILGISLGIKPNSIKNYRDEFDPFFSNNRKGWHRRQSRDYCQFFYKQFGETNFTDFSSLIKSYFINNYEIEKFVAKLEKKDASESVVKRLITGKAAEEYFKIEYKSIEKFSLFNIEDTTNLACGFDYKLSLDDSFYCVEVKGLSDSRGNVQMTEKEFRMAQAIKEKYCLFIVKNFKERPIHDIFFDPLNSRLKFTEHRKEIIQTTFTTSI